MPPTPSSRRRASTTTPAGARVRVRMYRQGLGDCHLLTFNAGGDERHVLIDCGSLGATSTGVAMSQVMADIRATTKDHLHLVIATHEHWDHVSGFNSLEKDFRQITVDHVWMAWTEDPGDPLARTLAKTRRDLGAALTAAAGALAASPDDASAARGRSVRDLLGFYGRDTSALGAADFAVQLDAAMQFVRTGLGPTARYFQPGEGPVEESWLPGFRVYVLGPPRDEAALNDLGEHGSSDLYGLSSGLGVGARQRASGGPADEEAQADMPFDARFRHPLNDASTRRSASRAYWNQAEAWRRVDDDWLHVATDMALQLDSATNNSSLALAFERISDGKVLLFPGDAQQGNWLSWHAPSMRWTVPVSPGGRSTHTVTAADLLKRTVLYKVGHHASHNATAKAKGLELMTSPDLTAFIPVDRAVALTRNPKGSWKMPARDLYRRLLERCQGRVVRSDVGWADTSTRATRREVEQEFDRLATSAEWTAWKKAQQSATHVRVTPLFAEFTLV